MDENSRLSDRLLLPIRTKTEIPRARRLLSRPRLLNLLLENVHRRLMLVCAGPGYGKTSLLVDFAHRTCLPVCWYTPDAHDRDPRVFLDYIVEAVRVRYPSFGEQTRALLHRGGVCDLRDVIGRLVNELSALPDPKVVLVIDEYQTVASEASVNRALALLLEYLPANIHLIVASRVPPPLPHIRLVAYGQVEGIGADLLRFTMEEARAVLQEHFEVSLSDETIRALVEKSEGWITGILLGVQTIWRHLSTFLARLTEPRDRLYDYLTQEALSGLPPDMRDFLRRISILRRVEAGLCDALLQREDSAAMLRWLEERNLFLVSLAGGWYRFHGLFQESLLQEIRKEQDEFVRLNLRAAELWRERGETGEAIEHLLQAGAHEQAAMEVERLVRPLFARGLFQTIAHWAGALAPEACRAHPQILLFQGKVALEMGGVEEALSLLRTAERLLEQGTDHESLVQARADISLGLRLQGHYEEALRMAQETIPMAEGGAAAAIVDLYRVAGVSLAALGRLPDAEAHLREAVRRSLAGPSLCNQALAYQDLGVCLLQQGKLDEADEAGRQALERWRAIGSPGPVGCILNNLAMRPFARGAFGQAADLLQQALESVETSLSPYYRALVRASLSDLRRDQGDWGAAWRFAQEGLRLAQESGNTSLTAYLDEALGNLARHYGDFAEAERYLHDALAAAGSSTSDRARIQVSRALLEITRGCYEAADDLLKDAQAVLEAGKEYPQVLRAQIAQVISWKHQGRSGAQERFRQVVLLGSQQELLEPFVAEAELLAPLLHGPVPEEGAALITSVRQIVQGRALPPMTTPLGEDLPPMRLIAFGPGRVYRGDEEVPIRAWRGQLPREIFFYLYFHSPVSRERLGAEFWPEVDSAGVTARVHNMLYRVRQAMGDPGFVELREGLYTWNPGVSCWCDARAFEETIRKARALPPHSPGARILLERAVALYQGDFLEDFYREWCRGWRDRLRTAYLQALLRLGWICGRLQDFERGAAYFRQATEADNFCEEAYQGLIGCYMALGERNLAIHTYRQCCEILDRELGVLPAEETRALYEAIMGGESPPQEIFHSRPA